MKKWIPIIMKYKLQCSEIVENEWGLLFLELQNEWGLHLCKIVLCSLCFVHFDY